MALVAVHWLNSVQSRPKTWHADRSKLTAAKAALEDVRKLVHEPALYNFTCAQVRRTLSTAQSCLDSLRIRIEAQVNTVEETVKQRQVSLALHHRQETAEAPVLLAELSTKRKPCLPFQTSTSSCSTTLIGLGSEPSQRWITPVCQWPCDYFLWADQPPRPCTLLIDVSREEENVCLHLRFMFEGFIPLMQCR